MFRRVFFTSAIALSFALVAPVSANAQNFFVSVGVATPTGDGGDFIDTGWMATGGVTFAIGEDGLWAGVEGAYGGNSSSNSAFDFTANPWSAMGFLGYSFDTAGNLDPYVFGGGGLQGIKVEDFSENAFGYQFGAGTSFGNPENSVRPYAEVRYQGTSDDEVDITFWAVLLGMSISTGN